MGRKQSAMSSSNKSGGLALSTPSEPDETEQSGCSMSTVESKKCRLEEGPDGKPVQKCEILRRVMRQCPGKPVEELESTREETTNSVDASSGFEHFDAGPLDSSLNENFGAFHSMFEDFAGMFEKDFRSAFPSFPEEHGFPQGPCFPRFPRRSHGPEDVKRKKKPFPAGFSGDDFQEA